MFTDQGRNHDIEEILAGRQEWGALFKYHWSGRPQLGYYCLSRDKQVLVKHAEQLRDAGVDFIAIDSTNSYYADPEAQHQVFDNRWWDPLTDPVKMVQQPVDALLEIWSGIPGAPKVVPFTPVKNDPSPQAKTITGTPCPKPDMQRFWNERLNPRTGRYKNMGFLYFGKPLWLASRARVKAPAHKCLDADGKHPFASDPEALADLSHFYTIRKMWGLLGSPERAGYSSEEWSFIENCQDRFKELNGSAPCNQRIAFYNGKPEELSVSAAYQRFPGSGYISDKATAVPKLNGATLHRIPSAWAAFRILSRNAMLRS
ncbi:hypothetical protein [Methylocystis rosea]|uniref:Uncharacterized protein n=1 Tax=Methylocystis rosea TaxID=173366 RepID=A0A3G8M7Z5_9HYPH|nr:hypothetical protein [Methylocystis rosea]AZG78093.1 hypothetical protein EHO51_15875 [Methylocystis rosea]